MHIPDWLQAGLKSRLNDETLKDKDKQRIIRTVTKEFKREKPPEIAVIGSCGVGKSSTINALFGTSLKVSHTVAGTLIPTKIPIKGKSIKGQKGELILHDMPGLGEDIDKDKEYENAYRKIIAQCDVAVWVISASDRRITEDQRAIRNIVGPANRKVLDRMIIGMNKIDLIHPNNWIQDVNLPSIEQENNLSKKIKDVREKMIKSCPGLTEERIIGYSAKQRYRLQELFGAMLHACPKERAWVLDSRQKIDSFWDCVDPKLKGLVEAGTKGGI